MKSNNAGYKYSTIKVRLVLSYSIFVFLCLLLITFLYKSSIEESQNELINQNKAVFQSSVHLFDKNLLLIDSHSRQLIQDSTFNRIARMTDNDDDRFYINAYNAIRNLPLYFYAYSYIPIDSFYIYLRNNDYVLAIRKFEPSHTYYSKTLLHSEEFYDEWYFNMTQNLTKGAFKISDYSEEYKGNLSYIVDLSQLTYKSVEATVCYNLNVDIVKSTFADLHLKDSGYMVILNSEGKEVFHVNDSNSPTLSLDTLLSLEYTEQMAYYDTMLITKRVADFSKLEYYLVQPLSVFQDTVSINPVFILLIVLFTVTSALIILALIKEHMKPIVFLDNRLKETISAQTQLQQVVDFQKPYIGTSYVRELMLGDISGDDELNYIKEYLALNDENLVFNAIYVMYYHIEDSEYMEQEDINETVKVHLKEAFTGMAVPHVYTPTDNSFVMLLYALDEADDLIAKAEERFIVFHNKILTDLSIWVFAGIGENHSQLLNIWEAYRQAEDMANSNFKNLIFLPYEIRPKDSNSYYYPAEISEKMTVFITTGNKERVRDLFTTLYRENFEERSLPNNLLNFWITDIRNTLARIRFSVNDSESPVLNEIDDLFNKNLNFQNLKTIAFNLCEVFSSPKKPIDLINTIVEYIDNNYDDPSLGLNKISHEFHISESYFSHLFKDTQGTNFSSYLESVRMNHAIELIKQPKCNISDLYGLVGYNTPTSFRRAFKKTFGLSPSEYQKKL